MHIRLERQNPAVHFRAVNDEGNELHIDGGEAVGGQGLGFRPMETVLAGLAGCSAMDLVHIIGKQRMDLADVRIDVEAERADAVPAPFTKIHLHYDLYGELDSDRCARAVSMALEKYCSVAVMLEKSASITYSFKIHPGETA